MDQVSRSESLGNIVFTTAILSYFKDHPKEIFPSEFLTQNTVGACLRAVRLVDKNDVHPPTINLSTNIIVENYLKDAQDQLIKVNSIWTYLPSFTQTFNQSARSYATVLVNNLWMHATKRLRTVISVEIRPYLEKDNKLKLTRSYIHNRIFRSIVGATMETLVGNYKNEEDINLHAIPFLQSEFVLHLIKEHQEWLHVAQETMEKDGMVGVLKDKNIQNKPHLFISHQLYLAQRLDDLRLIESKSNGMQKKATFQIIPQLTMKRRCVTFGKEQTTELLYHLAQQNLVGEFITEDRIPTKIEAEEDEIIHLSQRVEELQTTLMNTTQDLVKMVRNGSTDKSLHAKRMYVERCRSKLNNKESILMNRRVAQEKRKHKVDEEVGTSKRRKTGDQRSWQVRLTIQQIRNVWAEANRNLFTCPKKLKRHWNGVVTTDGVIASWHLLKPLVPIINTTRRPNKKVTSIKPTRTLEPKLYGTHGVDVLFELTNPFNVIAVDPGHVELIHSVRSHRTEDAVELLDACLDHLLPAFPSKGKGSRRMAKHRLLKEKQRSTFRLTNRQWAHETGRLALREKTHRLHRSLSLQDSIDDLSKFSSKTSSRSTYLNHAAARVRTAPAFIQLMQIKSTSRWKFETYQKEQRAVEKLSTDLLGGLSPTNTLVVWGNGSFGATSKGHDSAPNKTLRHLLSRFVPIVMNSEYNTSKLSCCHHTVAVKLSTEGYSRRGTVLKCKECSTMLGRDENAAHNILHIFQYQHEHQGEAPAAFRPSRNVT